MTRVAIIGAGPCGLAELQAFARAKEKGAELPEIVCYEKQSDWGGLWNYSWRTGTDEYGDPVHGSMYRYLWSNGPKECLEFADYSFDEHFGKPIPSFPPRAVLYDYIIGRAEKSGIKDYIEFNQAVRWVTYDPSSEKFTLMVEDRPSKAERLEAFDWVIVASGHFSVPNVPTFDGIESFPGRVLHAHDFRSADEFKGKNLLIVGSSYSAEDIGLQCWKYGAKSVTISYRSGAMGFDWPEGMKEVPLIDKIDGATVSFKDGTSGEFDAILLCTGYQHHFPFMEKSLRLETKNRLYPPGLYKGTVWLDNPKLLYLGMQDQYYTFNMFDAQAWWARDVVLGKIALPSAAEMAADADAWLKREEALEDPYQDIDFQTDFSKDLAAATDYPPIDFDMIAKMFYEWEHDKDASITGYRNKSFTSPVTGTKAPVHHTVWVEALDDSLETFLTQPEQSAAE